jgi:hypothetical protein
LKKPIEIEKFSGLYPRITEFLLPHNAATVAENCDFAYGEMRSIKDSYLLKTIAENVAAVFSEDGLRFYTWPNDCNAVISPIGSGSANALLYYTTNGDFRVTLRSGAGTSGGQPAASYRVGVPKASTAPSISIDNTSASADVATTSTCAYAFAYANIYNEEGAPSPPATASFRKGAKLTIGCQIDAFGTYAPIKEIRVYRTQNDGVSTNYYFAFAIPAIGASGTLSLLDTVPAALLNEPLSSNHFYPPNPALKGLIDVGNGILAAWLGTELWFSDAYKPWSWPPKYMKSFAWAITGVEAQGSGVLVTTIGKPYFVYGVSPDSMTSEPLNVDQAGVSKWSIASVGGKMIYASNDGIVTINGGVGSLDDSEMFFTREVWRSKYGQHLGTMQFTEFDGALIVFSRNNSFTPFMLRLDEGKGSMTDLPGLIANSAFYLVTTDGLCFSKGSELYQFGAGASKDFVWSSKEFLLGGLLSPYSLVRTLTFGTFSIEFWAEGILRHTQAITPQDKFKTFRLPGGYQAQSWRIKISGSGRFSQIKIVDDMRQLEG